MNILIVGDNSQESAALAGELTKYIPAIQTLASPNAQDALAQFQASGTIDAVVLETSIPLEDALRLTDAVKKGKRSASVVVLLAAGAREVPKEFANAGIDRFLPARPGYAAVLAEALQQMKDPRRAEAASNTRRVRLLFAGNVETIRPHLAGMPYLLLEPVSMAPDGSLQLPQNGTVPGDLLIIDGAVTGKHTLSVLKAAVPQIPEVPIILLTDPADEDTPIQAIRSGAADCIPKSGNYCQRLIPAVEREIRMRELAREKESLKARGARLRQIVEAMPVGVTQIAPDGTFLAINQTGLQLMGATRIEQVTGKNLLHLAPHEEREKIHTFLTTISGWANATMHLNWKGVDGSVPGIELRGIPMRRDPGGPACALATIHPPSGHGDAHAEDEIRQRCDNLTKTLRAYEVRFKELQEKNALKQAKWEAAVRQAESRCQAAEEHQAKLKEAAEETSSKIKFLIEEHGAERSSWEQSRQSFREQCAKIEAVAESLRAAQTALLEKQQAEQEQWNLQRQELEQKLASAETSLSGISHTLSAERSQLAQTLKELQQKYEAAEEQRAALETILHEAGTQITQQAETYTTERAQQEQAQRELENKYRAAEEARAGLEAQIRDAEARIARQAEQHAAAASRQDSAYRELTQKFRDIEAQRAAIESDLRAAEARIAQQSEKHESERTQQALAQRELSQKLLDAETQRAAMEAQLRDAEARTLQLATERSAERAQSDAARLQWAQQFHAAEEQRAAAKEALTQAEALAAQRIQQQVSERAQWDQVRLELEDKLQHAVRERDAISEALRTADSGLRQQAENLAAECSRRDLIQLELEQRCKNAEDQVAGLRESLANAEVQIGKGTGVPSEDLARMEQAQQELEQRCRIAEEQQSALQTALLQERAQREQQAAAHGSERAQWEEAQRTLAQQIQAAEEKRASLQAAVREAEGQRTEAAARYEAERSRQELAQEELEQMRQAAEEKRLQAEASLRDTEGRLLQVTENYLAERTRQQQVQQELQEKCQAAETQRSAILTALTEAETRLAHLSQQQDEERGQLELAHRALEAKYQAAETRNAELHTTLREAEARVADLTENHNAERARQEQALRDNEQKYQSAEKQLLTLQTALAEAESRIAQLKDKHSAELAQRDLARKELELKFQAADKQRAALQTALNSTESSLAQLAEKHRTEISQFEFAQKKSEQKFQAAEKQRSAMQAELRDAELKLAELTEKYNAERAQWETSKTAWDQRLQDADKEHAVALQNAVRETESRLAWISDQNQAKALQLESLQKELEQLQADYRNLTTESTDIRLRYQRLSQFTSAGVVLAGVDGTVLQCNDTAAQMFGYGNSEEALAQPEDHPFRIYAFEGALKDRLQQDGKLENIEWTALGQDGKLIRIQEYATIVESPSGDTMLVERILTDISKTHKLSEEIRRVRRMESAGDLAAATIKSFKDLCTSLSQSSEQLIAAAEDSAAVRRQAESLQQEANRGVKHARQFLSVAQKADRAPALLSLNDILTNNDALLHSLIGEDIDLMTTLAPRIGLISADSNEVIQLIGNLLANAREALPLGGVVTIETSNIEVDSSTSDNPEELHPGIYVRMIFSTDGCAVQPERRNASIRMIVDRLGGCLVTTNDSKSGNTHKVYLPRVEAPAGQAGVLSKTASA